MDDPTTPKQGLVTRVAEATDKALEVATKTESTTQVQERVTRRNAFVTWLNTMLIIVLGLAVFGLTYQVQSRNRAIQKTQEAVKVVNEATIQARTASAAAVAAIEADRLSTLAAIDDLRKFAEERANNPEAAQIVATLRETHDNVVLMRELIEQLARTLCGDPCLPGGTNG